MKRTFKTLTATVFGIGMLLSSTCFAATSGNSEYVTNVDLSFIGPEVVINVKNAATNKNVENVSLSVLNSKIDIGISGFVECKNANNVEFLGASAYFGGLGIGGFGQLTTSGTLHSEQASVAYKEKGGVAEYTEDTFSVPLNKIKAGHPALRVDPIDELNKKLQAHMNGGGKKADFYKQDQQIVLQRPISIGAVCGKLKDTDKRSVGFETQNVAIKIKYEGDPEVTDKPVLNAQLGQANVPNQINNDLPFKLDKATFQANMPNYTGKCIPDQNPKIRMNFQVSGSERGLIDLKVAAVSNTYGAYGNYFETTGMVRDPKNGGGHLDFSFPLKEMLAQQKYSYMAIADNKTYSHNMKIMARYKNLDDGTWSEYKDFGTAVFKHRCTPQVAVPMGGNGGKIGGYQDGGAEKPKMKLQAAPVDPTPAPGRDIKAADPKPKPGLLLPAIQK